MNLKNLYQNEYSFEETVNENFFKVDSFAHLSILGEISSSNNEENTIAKELYLIVPPQPDENGIITPDTLFQDKINQIACYHNNIGWLFYTPKIGDIAYIRSRNGFYYFTGAQWNIMTTGSSSGGGSSTTSPTPTGNTGGTGGTSSSSVESISLNNPFSLGMIMRSKQGFTHPSWLKSDATLKSGAVYASMYLALLDAFNNGTEGTIEIVGTTYNTKEKDGFVVISATDWQTIYSNYGIVAQYGLDTINQQFYLPYGEEKNRILVSKKEPTDNDKTWYNLYSDGWVEQGGIAISNYPNSARTETLPIAMRDTNYTVLAITTGDTNSNVDLRTSYIPRTALTTTSFVCRQYSNGAAPFYWTAKGYTNTTNLASSYADYYYVGDTIQSSYAINLDTLLTKLNTLENRIQELENA